MRHVVLVSLNLFVVVWCETIISHIITQTSEVMLLFSPQVVPTIYTDITGHKTYTNQVWWTWNIAWPKIDLGVRYLILFLQFSVTEHFREGDVYPKPVPGVLVVYDFSPIKVSKLEYFLFVWLGFNLLRGYWDKACFTIRRNFIHTCLFVSN